MRLLLATMKHETNTFSHVPTPISRFFADGQILENDAAINFYSGTATVLGGYLDVARASGAEFVVPIAADGWPSGRVQDSAFEEMAGRICDAFALGGFDGVLLDLHGAMVTESFDDGEGELLQRLRGIDAETPIALALDMHANISPAMVSNIDLLCGYQTYPHIDERETGIRAARILIDMIRGQIKPTMAWGAAPMLPHVMAQSSLDQPNKGLQKQCIEVPDRGAIDASLFTGFPHADTPFVGLSAAVITDDDPDLAQELRDELLQYAWSERSNFDFEIEPLAASVSRAKKIGADHGVDKPVFLLDHYDNAASGGSMRHTTVLREIVQQGLENVVFFAILDPDAVATAHKAGLHQEVRLDLCGPDPLCFEGTVSCLSDGRGLARDGEYSGVLIEMGLSAVISSGSVDLIVISMPMEPFDRGCFEVFNIDPESRRFVVLKSRVHWRAAFDETASTYVPCAGTGACTSNYAELDFQKVRRPIFPLDPQTEYAVEKGC